ncbi:MAG: WD40 repeat domain-containing protein [Promethearchaeota archaeon]
MYRDQSSQTQSIIQGKIGHIFSVMRVASFHHSPRFASSSFDGTVRIWDNEKQEKVLFFFSEAIEGLSITPDDNNIIVVLADSSKAFLYNLQDDKMCEIGSGKAFRNLLGTNPSSTKAAFVTFDDNVFIFNLITRSIGARIFVENVSGDSLIWINDNIICIPKRNGSVAIINIEKREIEQEVPVHDGLITSICRDGDRIVTVSEDGTGKILDLDFNPQFGFKIDFTPISVNYSAQAGVIVIAGERNMLIVNTSSGELLNLDQSLSGCNAIITLENMIVKGTGERDITLFSTTGEKLFQIDGHSQTAEFVSFIKEDSLVYASGDNHVHQLSLSTGNDQTLAEHGETISSVLFVPSKNWIISGGYDDSISIWDLASQSEVKRIQQTPLVTALAKSPYEDIFVAACSGDNTLHVLTLEGDKQTDWTAHDDFISAIFFMNDEVIISGSDDGFIKFWKRNGKLISSIKTKSPIKAIDTTLEYNYNVTGHLNGDLIFWEKISNRRIAHHNVQAPIQRIKVVNSSLVLFAAQNKLYLMEMDGLHITNVQEISQHTEPIRGIYWQEKLEKIITVAHNVEIFETTFIAESELTPLAISDEGDDSTVVFAPGGMEEELPEAMPSESVMEEATEESTVTPIDIEHLHKISEYLATISQQIKELVIPELLSFKIETNALQKALDDVRGKLKERLAEHSEGKEEVEGTAEEADSQEKKPDWTSIDWGKRKRE